MRDRFDGIYGLRAIAALLVFSAHATLPFMSGGGIGVDIFFAISGYLITRTFIQNKKNLVKFWLYRAFRIYPPLVAAALISCTAIYFTETISIQVYLNNLMPSLLGVANIARVIIHSPTFLGHMWSIGVEEQFYLIFPLIFILISKFPKRHTSTILLFGVVLVIIYRIILLKYFYVPEGSLFQRPDTRMDGLLLGAALATSHPRATAFLAKFWPVSLLFLSIAAVYENWWQTWLYLGGFSLLSLASCAVIAQLVVAPESGLSRALSTPPLKK